MSVEITVFDGAKSIGGSKIHLKADDVGLFLDFGINYSKWGCYYEEFLRPRGSRGLVDLVALDLIPPIKGIYRDDLSPSDLSGLELDVPVDALFLSHAHFDHAGYLSLLRCDMPVYASAMSAVIMKAVQDTGKTEADAQTVYIGRKERHPENARILKSIDWRKCPYEGRPFLAIDDADFDDVNEFWTAPPNPGQKARRLETARMKRATPSVKNIPFRAFPVDHSIFGAVAYAFETPIGWIIYTGDFRRHGVRASLTEAFLEAAAGLSPAVLIVEGTRVNEASGLSENAVSENSVAEVKRAGGKLVVADFGARNVDRLLIFLEVARETGRKLVVLAKDAYLLQAMGRADRAMPDVMADAHLAVFEELKEPAAWERELRRTCASVLVSADAIRHNPGDYILAFSFWDLKHLIDIALPSGGIYIYSTSEAYTEEQEVDVCRLSNWLKRFNLTPVGFEVPDQVTPETRCKPKFVGGFHASGHIAGEDLFQAIRAIGPKKVIPVHTERPDAFVERLGRNFNVVLPEEGQTIRID